MKKAVVIGGSGFVGSHVSDHLSNAGYKVTIYDKTNSKWLRNDQELVYGDVQDFEKLNEAVKNGYSFIAFSLDAMFLNTNNDYFCILKRFFISSSINSIFIFFK